MAVVVAGLVVVNLPAAEAPPPLATGARAEEAVAGSR
jgi:hypothetical protein